jgi:Ca-activated chloride channel homolog
MIGFGSPLLLVALIAVPVIAAVIIFGMRRRRRAEDQFAGGGLASLRSGRVSPLLSGAKLALLLTVAGLLAVSMARPQAGQTSLLLPREGGDVVIAIDVSRSMQVADVQASRLDAAKRAAKSLINHLGGDRVGLVAFAGSSTLRFPLTTDDEAASQVIDSLGIEESGIKPGTDIADALATARGAFSADNTRSKVVVIVSDGEELSGDDLAAAKAAADSGLIVHTVGVGTSSGGPVFAVNPRNNRSDPVIDPATGKQAISFRDDANLRQLASAGQGRAYDGNTTDFAFDLGASIDRLEKTRFNSGATNTPIERFQIPLALALALLVIDTLLIEGALAVRWHLRSRRRSLAGGPASSLAHLSLFVLLAPLLLFLNACSSGPHTVENLNRDGNRAYQAGDFAKALETYRRAEVLRPDLPALNYNAGNSLYRQNDFEHAVGEDQRAVHSSDPEVQDRAYYSMGNAYVKANQLREAADAYKSALRANPSDVDAKYNLEVIQRQIDEQQARQQANQGQQPQPGQNGQQNPNQQGQGEGQGEPHPANSAQAGQPATGETGAGQPGQPSNSTANGSASGFTGTPAGQAENLDPALKRALDQFRQTGSVDDALQALDILGQQERLRQAGGSTPRQSQGRDW